MESLFPISVCSVIRISQEKVRQIQQKMERTHSTSHDCRKQRVVPEQSFYGEWLRLRSPTSRIPHRPWSPSGPCAEVHPHASFGGTLIHALRQQPESEEI